MKDNFKPHSKELNVDTENLIQIDVNISLIQLNLSIEEKFISDNFLWDINRTYQADIWIYTKYLLRDLLI